MSKEAIKSLTAKLTANALVVSKLTELVAAQQATIDILQAKGCDCDDKQTELRAKLEAKIALLTESVGTHDVVVTELRGNHRSLEAQQEALVAKYEDKVLEMKDSAVLPPSNGSGIAFWNLSTCVRPAEQRVYLQNYLVNLPYIDKSSKSINVVLPSVYIVTGVVNSNALSNLDLEALEEQFKNFIAKNLYSDSGSQVLLPFEVGETKQPLKRYKQRMRNEKHPVFKLNELLTKRGTDLPFKMYI